MIIECTPLYQGVVLLRDLTVGVVGPDLLWRAGYLAALGLVGLYVAGRRLSSCSWSDPRPCTVASEGSRRRQAY